MPDTSPRDTASEVRPVTEPDPPPLLPRGALNLYDEARGVALGRFRSVDDGVRPYRLRSPKDGVEGPVREDIKALAGWSQVWRAV